jgi:hypothetical protein
VEFLLDKYEKKIILQIKNFKIEIPLSKVEYVKEGLIIKKFLRGFYTKNKNCILGFFSNFGINYFYCVNFKNNFKTITIKLKDYFINYLIISVPKDFYFLINKILEKA